MLALTGVLALLAAACGGEGSGPLELGVKRIALKLILADEELAEPVEPRRIVRIVPVPPEFREPDVDLRFVQPEFVLLPPCPTAAEGARPNRPTTHIIERPPVPARYPRLNKGSIRIQGGPFPISLPFPPLANWEIPAVERVEEPSALGGEPATHTEFEVRKRWFQGFEQIERFRITDTALQLVQRTTKVQGAQDRVFTPTSPIDFYRYGLPGTTWSQGAIDVDRQTALVRDAAIVGRELVDVCGELVDTIRFEVDEQMINLETQETTGTPDGDPIIYNIATQFGGIVIREDYHVLFSTSTEDGVPILVEFDYVSTQANHEPQPLPEADA